MIILVNSFPLRSWQDGANFGPISFIRRSADTPAIRAHEQEHEKWFWRNPLFYGLLCLFSDDYRLKSEVAAYKAQIAVDPSLLLGCAHALSEYYDLNISITDALGLLYDDTSSQ